MEFHLAGSANDPNYADAEALLDDLSTNLPQVTVTKHMKDPEKWDEWARRLCRRMGFPEKQLAQGPIIWAAGRAIGNQIDIKSYTEKVYGRCVTRDQRDLHMLAQENLRLCNRADAAQAERQQELQKMLAEDEVSQTKVTEIRDEFEEKRKALDEGKEIWTENTEAAQVCLGRLDRDKIVKALHRSDPKPSTACCKLARFVVRVAWPETPDIRATEALSQCGCLDLLKQWLTAEEGASPLFNMEPQQRQVTAGLMKRALADLTDGSAGDSSKTTEKAIVIKTPPPVDDEGQLLEDALRVWCQAVLGLCGWAAITQYRDDLASVSGMEEELLAREARAEEVKSAVVQLEYALKVNSDPYDPTPEETGEAAADGEEAATEAG